MGKEEITYNYSKQKSNWVVLKDGRKIKLRKYLKDLCKEVGSIFKRFEEIDVELEFSRKDTLNVIIQKYNEGGLENVAIFMYELQQDLIDKMNQSIIEIKKSLEEAEEIKEESPVADKFVESLSEEIRKELADIQDVDFEEIKPDNQGLGIEGVDPHRL